MNKNFKDLAAEWAKSLKIETNHNQFSRMLTKFTVQFWTYRASQEREKPAEKEVMHVTTTPLKHCPALMAKLNSKPLEIVTVPSATTYSKKQMRITQ